MNSIESTRPSHPEPTPNSNAPVEVARFPKRSEARHAALALHSMDIPSAILPGGHEWIVAAPFELHEQAASQLNLYRSENQNWPPRRASMEVLSDGSIATMLYVAVLFFIFAFDRIEAFGGTWPRAGVADAALIRGGAWWRAFTALTLHVDIHHLLGNLLFGSIFLVVACQILGTPRALLSMVLAGALGNLANAWIQLPSHTSVGASTAVFGAVGLVAAATWRVHRATRPGLSVVPLLVGLFFLGYLGMGDGRVDVGAHATGFLAGLVIGALRGGQQGVRSIQREKILAWGTPALLVGAWTLAILFP